MAVDSWVPRRFSQLSDRLVTQNGVFLMGLAAIAALLYTRGNITMLVVMYSINVFLTFSLTELGMSRHWIVDRHKEPRWKGQLAIHGTGLVLCLTILVRHALREVRRGRLDDDARDERDDLPLLPDPAALRAASRRTSSVSTTSSCPSRPFPVAETALDALDHKLPTAVLTVDRFSGYGLHQILSIHIAFPELLQELRLRLGGRRGLRQLQGRARRSGASRRTPARTSRSTSPGAGRRAGTPATGWPSRRRPSRRS